MSSALLSFPVATTLRSKSGGGTLPAAGALTTGGVQVNVQDVDRVTLYFDYTQGGAAGAFEFVCELSNDNGLNFYRATLDDLGTITVLAAPVAGFASAVDGYVKRFAARSDKYTYSIVMGRDTMLARFEFAEYGNVGAPGTLGATISLMGAR